MTEFLQCVLSNNGIAYLTGAGIFLITLFLIAKRVIGLAFAILLLAFALLAALSISNQDAIRDYFHQEAAATATQVPGPGETKEGAQINAEIQKTFNDLKAEFLIYKDKLEALIKDLSTKKEDRRTDAIPKS